MPSSESEDFFGRFTFEPEFSVTLRDGQWTFFAKNLAFPVRCPSCGGPVNRHGWKRSIFIDAPFDGRPSRVVLNRPRFKCRACGKTTIPDCPGLDTSQGATSRLRKFVKQWRAGHKPPTSVREIAQEIGASTTFASSLLRQVAEEATKSVRGHIDLAIYEVSTSKAGHWVLLDLGQATPLDFLPAGSACLPQLSGKLRRYAETGRLRTVTIPVSDAVATCVATACESVPIRVSLASIHDAIAKVICRVGGLNSRRGQADGRYRARLREIAAHRFRRLTSTPGIRSVLQAHTYATFWAAYEAKESLIRSLGTAATGREFVVMRLWLTTLPAAWHPEFRSVARELGLIESVGAVISRESDIALFDAIGYVLERLAANRCESLQRDLAIASIWLSDRGIDKADDDSRLESHSESLLQTSVTDGHHDSPSLDQALEFLTALAAFNF